VSCAVPGTAFLPPGEVEDQDSGNLTLNHSAVTNRCNDRSTNHRSDLNLGHDSSMRTSGSSSRAAE
jgi:hypothetical protein